MAITVTSKYKPFTYEELVKPLEGYWKKYDEAEKELGDLSTKLSALDYIVQSEPEDSPLRAKYSNYKSKLETAAETLGRDGLNQEVRNLLKEANASFAKDISPIATQYARRQKLEDEQRKTKESKPSVYFSKRAAETSLAEMIENPNWSYTSFVGNDITKAVQDMVSPVATILDDIWKDGQIGNNDKILSKYGISPEDVSAYFNGEFKGGLAKFFDDARNTAVRSYGIDKWDDQDALTAAYNYANMGIPKAIGKLTPQLVAPKKGDKGDGGNNPNDTYPGTALNFDTSVRYTPDSDKVKTADDNVEYNKNIPANEDLRHNDVISMAARFKNEGIITKEDLDEYEQYLQELAQANHADITSGKNAPARKAIGYTIYQQQNTTPKADAVRQKYKHKYDNIEGKISQRDINKFRELVEKQESFINRYTLTDDSGNRTGLYATDAKSSMNIGTQLEQAQSQEEMFIGTHKWDDNTKKAIIGQLQSQYESLRAANNLDPSKKYSNEAGNGLYKISWDNGTMSVKGIKPGKIPAKFWDNADVVFTAQHGMLIIHRDPNSNEVTMYKLKGSGFMNDADEVADIYRESKDFSPKSIKSYVEQKNKNQGIKGYHLGGFTLNELLDKSKDAETVRILIENSDLVRSEKNPNFLIAYVNASRPGKGKNEVMYTIAKVIIDSRTGEKVSVTTVDNELGIDGLGVSLADKYAQDKLQGIATTKSNEAVNLNTGPATRTKGSNPIRY